MQKDVWEKEYQNSKLVTADDKPQKFILRFLKYYKKNSEVPIERSSVLDLGCGTGRNSNYLAQQKARVTGLEISDTALNLAKKRMIGMDVSVDYRHVSIGDILPVPKNHFDLVLDITSSNSLNEKERSVYLQEVKRVLKEDGYFFVRALCKDGDKNAKSLIKEHPGPEKDTYVLPELKLVERVFSRQDFEDLYGKHFEIETIEKQEAYTRFRGQSYKRCFWLAILKK